MLGQALPSTGAQQRPGSFGPQGLKMRAAMRMGGMRVACPAQRRTLQASAGLVQGPATSDAQRPLRPVTLAHGRMAGLKCMVRRLRAAFVSVLVQASGRRDATSSLDLCRRDLAQQSCSTQRSRAQWRHSTSRHAWLAL